MAESSWMRELAGDIYESMGDAVSDIRQKVVEEGYFGRAVTQLDVDAPQCDGPDWPETQEPEREQPEQQQEHGMDI